MLIFLGIIFLFTMVRELFNPSESSKAIAKIQESTASLFTKEFPSLSFSNQAEALQNIETTLTESVDSAGLGKRVKEAISDKLSGWCDYLPFAQKRQVSVANRPAIGSE
jgi:hypothetical protein